MWLECRPVSAPSTAAHLARRNPEGIYQTYNLKVQSLKTKKPQEESRQRTAHLYAQNAPVSLSDHSVQGTKYVSPR